MKNTMRFAFLSIAALISSACVIAVESPDRPEGRVSAQYAFDGLDCEDVGVDLIELTLEREDGFDWRRETIACASADGFFTFAGLDPGIYLLRVDGLRADGRMIFTADVADIDVRRGAQEDVWIDARSLSSELSLYWTFEGSGACGAVREVRVRLTDEQGEIYDDARYPCDFEGVIYDDIRPGIWTARIEGLGVHERILFWKQVEALDVQVSATNAYTIDLARAD